MLAVAPDELDQTDTLTAENNETAVEDDLKIQERNLMQKDYRDEISAELFSKESTRIRRERVDASAIVARLKVDRDEIEKALALVLAFLSHDLHDLYLRATPNQRRFINQAIFAAIWISHEDIQDAQLNAPFDAIQAVAEATRLVNQAAERLTDEAENGKAPNPSTGSGALAQGSIRTSMVGIGGAGESLP